MKLLHSRNVSVVGCGKLGTPLIACLAEAGHKVTGIDLNLELINNLQRGVITWNEPGLAELLSANSSRIKFQSQYENAFEESEITFVIVPTPSMASGEFSNDFVLDAVSKVGIELSKGKPKNHLVVIVSTVMPGSTQGVIKEKLHESAGSNSNSVQICYSPEFIALGTVIKNMQYPDLVLIGQENEQSGNLLEEISLSVVKNKPLVSKLSIPEAEISKIAINSFVTAKISFSNQISELCELTSNCSAVKVLEAIGNDSRIGRSYLAAGAGFGGPCFPRDNRAFNKFANSLGLNAELAIATDSVNARQNNRVLKLTQRLVAPGGKILVVGLSYKPDTDVVEESPGLAFLFTAREAGYEVHAVDEHVRQEQISTDFTLFKPDKLQTTEYDAAILFVPAVGYSKLPDLMDSKVKLIDLWGLWSDSQQHAYYRLGNYYA